MIVSNDYGNRSSQCVTIIPLTSKSKRAMLIHIAVPQTEGLLEDSVALTEQIRTVDKQRVGRYVCCLSIQKMEEIDKAIKISLALNDEGTFSEKEDVVNELQIFNNDEFGEIRTVVENGEPMFCLTDVCKALELSNTAMVKGRLNEKGVSSIDTLTKGGTQKLLYINEANLYKTIFQSRKESAERFSDWVAGEVLPTLRKTGSYHMKPMTPEEMMRVQLGMIDGHEERISKLENTMNIDYGQQRQLEKEVAKVVINVLGGKESSAYQEIGKKVFAECNRDVKDYFHVNSRNNIPRLRFEDAVDYIKNWQPCNNTRIAINDANAQMNFG